MVVVTGRDFRANQSKYIGMAQKGERVILSSKVGYAELTPLPQGDKDINEYLNSKCFSAVVNKVRQEYREGKGITCSTLDEIKAHLDSL